MPLKHKLDSLEGLDEALKPLYAKTDDGRWTLQVDEAPATATIAKLKEELSAATKALKDRESAEAKAKADAERAQLEARGDYEKLKASLEADAKAAKERAEALEAKIRNEKRDRAAMEAIQAAGGIPKALLPHIQGSLEVVAEADDFRVVVKGDPGKKLDAFVAGLKEDMPWGFLPTGVTGGGAPANPGGSGAPAKPWKEMNIDERTAVWKSNPTLARQLQGA